MKRSISVSQRYGSEDPDTRAKMSRIRNAGHNKILSISFLRPNIIHFFISFFILVLTMLGKTVVKIDTLTFSEGCHPIIFRWSVICAANVEAAVLFFLPPFTG